MVNKVGYILLHYNVSVSYMCDTYPCIIRYTQGIGIGYNTINNP